MYGRTLKIVRYYWREIAFRVIPKFQKWALMNGYADWTKVLFKHQKEYRSIEREVFDEIKIQHQNFPKNIYKEESQDDVLKKYQVETFRLDGIYIKVENGIAILDGKTLCTPEKFVTQHFEKNGYKVLFTESNPFHVLFGIFL
jgi:hypothetical protein